MLKRRAETGGHEKGAELVAIQRDSVRFVVHPRPPVSARRLRMR